MNIDFRRIIHVVRQGIAGTVTCVLSESVNNVQKLGLVCHRLIISGSEHFVPIYLIVQHCVYLFRGDLNSFLYDIIILYYILIYMT